VEIISKIIHKISYFSTFELLLVFHIVISLFLSLFETIYVLRRYKVLDKEDKKRLELLYDKSFFYKFLFKFSLHKSNPFSAFIWFFVFNLSTLFPGYIVSILIANYLVNVTYKVINIKTEIIDLEEFKLSFVNINRIFGESSVLRTILNEHVPLSKRLRAFAAITSTITPFSISIIKQTLKSNNDEIRLYAYSIINNIETRISDTLNKYFEILEKSEDEKEKAKIYKGIAFLYWEQLYINLSDEALKKIYIENIIKYSNLSLEYFEKHKDEIIEDGDDEKKENSNDILFSLYILLGKLYIRQRDYKMALNYFKKAQDIDPKSISVIPYIAEIYYQFREFDKTKELLSSNKEFIYNQRLYPIIYQWSKNE